MNLLAQLTTIGVALGSLVFAYCVGRALLAGALWVREWLAARRALPLRRPRR